jgi:pimeloyl-ACP methyl ester carboxylesterase
LSAWAGLARIECPALYVRAGSSVIPEAITDKIVAAIPNCRLTSVPDSFHHVMIDNPAGLITTLDEFLNPLA